MSVRQLANERVVKLVGLKERVKDGEAQEVVEKCRRIETMTESPGWADLMELMAEREQIELKLVMSRQASESASEYADFMGFLKGLRELDQTAKAVVAYGKRVENDLKQAEVEDQSESAGNAV